MGASVRWSARSPSVPGSPHTTGVMSVVYLMDVHLGILHRSALMVKSAADEVGGGTMKVPNNVPEGMGGSAVDLLD